MDSCDSISASRTALQSSSTLISDCRKGQEELLRECSPSADSLIALNTALQCSTTWMSYFDKAARDQLTRQLHGDGQGIVHTPQALCMSNP